MEYTQSIARIEATQAAFYATNTESALRAFDLAKKTHRATFGFLGYVRDVWA